MNVLIMHFKFEQNFTRGLADRLHTLQTGQALINNWPMTLSQDPIKTYSGLKGEKEGRCFGTAIKDKRVLIATKEVLVRLFLSAIV